MKKNRLLIYSQSDELLFMRNFFFLSFRKTVRALFYDFTIHCRDYFGFTYVIEDALQVLPVILLL